MLCYAKLSYDLLRNVMLYHAMQIMFCYVIIFGFSICYARCDDMLCN